MTIRGFQKKDIAPAQRVCIRLKALRESTGVTLEDLAEKTRISITYLEALEECRFDSLNLSPVYQKNFIKKYVQTLGKDPTPFLTQFTDEELTHTHHSVATTKTYRCSSFQLSNIPNALRVLTLFVVAIGLLSYLGFHVHNILKPPALIVLNPTDGYISEENNITITGSTAPETKIMVNDVSIRHDGEGNFAETIILNPGINALVITAENKHGRSARETRHVIYKHRDSVSLK